MSRVNVTSYRNNASNPLDGTAAVGSVVLGNDTQLYAYDGSNWCHVDLSVTTSTLEADIELLRTEVNAFKEREARILKLAEQYPGIAELKSQLDTMVALAESYNE
jgi:hypothetical protein